MNESSLREQRAGLVHELARQGIADERVLAAMGVVPREEFVPLEQRRWAYRNIALPIPQEQTISQPLIVALMAEALRLTPSQRVLEVGAGSGYAAAVLSKLAAEVFSIERHAELASAAADRLRRLGIVNVHIRHGDGTLGWPEQSPFDAISIAAAGPDVPAPLLNQLADGGRLVMPVGSHSGPQNLVGITRRRAGSFDRETLGGVRFVPLVPSADASP
jgi:protein-L-isoaspartate(D-aspartate) O-methyltransferase